MTARSRCMMNSILPVVGGFAGDRDVVDVALPQAGEGDAAEPRVFLQLTDGAAAGVAHAGLQSADELVHHVADRPLVADTALHPLGHQLELVLDVLLEVAVGGAARHRAKTSHAAV